MAVLLDQSRQFHFSETALKDGEYYNAAKTTEEVRQMQARAHEFVRGLTSAYLDKRAQKLARETSEASGLVSLSTTCRVEYFDENTIEIDRDKARITRMRKSVGISAKALHNLGSKKQNVYMLTLTYAGTNRDWRPEHISRFLDALRKWHYSRTGSKKVRYVWVAELQKRGVIHYHCVVWLDAGLTPPKPDQPWRNKGAWMAPMWLHGMSNRVKAFAPVAYLMKYASKGNSEGKFPHGDRISGVGGLDQVGRGVRRWVLWPAYVQANSDIFGDWKRREGGGYFSPSTGQILFAEFKPTGGGFSRFVRVHTNQKQIEAGGPFQWLPEVERELSACSSCH